MAAVLPIAMGVVIPTLTSWLSDQLPRPGLGSAENERRIRNIVLACMVGFGVYYIVEKLAKTQPMPATAELTMPATAELTFY